MAQVTAQAAGRLPKVLMLHGYTQNGVIFSKRLAALRKACHQDCEMIFVDGPIIVEMPTASGEELNKFDSTAIANPTTDTDASMIPRAWWRRKEVIGPDNQTHLTFEGFDESLRFIRKIIDEKGPFDACFGFSQGAALAGVISSILEEPSLHEAFSQPKLIDQKPFKTTILVSGFLLDMPRIWHGNNNNRNRKLITRSLHVIGKSDSIISEEQSRSLADIFLNSRVELHEGSHFVPSKKNWRNFFSNYFANLDQNDESLIPSPGQDPNTTPIDNNVTSAPMDPLVLSSKI